MKIIHHNDADGRCAAAIVVRHCRECERNVTAADLIEMDYAHPLELTRFAASEPVVIVDFSLLPPVMAKLLEITRDVTWIDHHQSCRDYDYGCALAGKRNFEDGGPSGCELAWQYFFPDAPMPLAVWLIGDYDSWRGELKPDSWDFRVGVELHDQYPLGYWWENLFVAYPTGGCLGPSLCERIIEEGRLCGRYRDQYCLNFRHAFGYETALNGFSAYACNLYRFGSQAFGQLVDEYDLCIAYAHDGQRWTVSLYSAKPGIDCAKIAKSFGGGGHTGAAGFSCTELPFAPIGAAKETR